MSMGNASRFASMSDDDIANLIEASKYVDMPNHLADVTDSTQKFVYKANINEKPTVLDDAAFDAYVKQNGYSKSEILARSVNSASYRVGGVSYTLSAQDTHDMVMNGTFNYIGGKYGGQVYGAGTYFEMNGGRNSGYGSLTMRGVLKKDARVISKSNIDSEWNKYIKKNPKTGAKMSSISKGSMSMKALIMGYSVITSASGNSKNSSGDYYNIIDRSALVLSSKTF